MKSEYTNKLRPFTVRNKYLEGLTYRCTTDFEQRKGKQWLEGFNECIDKLHQLEQSLTYITYEILAISEFCSHSDTIDFPWKTDESPSSDRLRHDVPIALARMAFNATILMSTRLSDISTHKHYGPLMEALDSKAFSALDRRIKALNLTDLQFIRDKLVAHIDKVSFVEIDSAVKRLLPHEDLLEFLDLLEPRSSDGVMSTLEAIDRILIAIRVVPKYCSKLIT
jgi:hypothetical protein